LRTRGRSSGQARRTQIELEDLAQGGSLGRPALWSGRLDPVSSSLRRGAHSPRAFRMAALRAIPVETFSPGLGPTRRSTLCTSRILPSTLATRPRS